MTTRAANPRSSSRARRRGPPRRPPGVAGTVAWAIGLLVAVLALGRGLLAPDPSDASAARVAVAQLAHLERGLEARADAMQELFPEGRVFTLALYGLTWVDVGRGTDDPRLRARALAEARRALALAETPVSRSTFRPAGGLPYGVFYEGWTGHLRAGVLHLGGGAAADTAFRAACDRLEAAFREGGPFIDTYPDEAWPADNATAAAVLRSCGTLLDARYTRAAEAWLRAALARADPATGLLPHTAWSPRPRGSSAALMARFVYEIDPAAAARQLDAFERTFATRFAGMLPAAREYPRGTDGSGDVDSGPLVLGVSAPASVVGVAAERIAGRHAAAAGLRAGPEVLGFPLQLGGRRMYAFGKLPIGDAFLAWVSVVRPWNQPEAASSAASPFAGWRWTWAAAWTAVAALCAARIVFRLRARRRG